MPERIEATPLPNGIIEYRVYKIRWIQLIVYVLSTFTNAISGMTFAPIESQTSTFFHIMTTQVNTLPIYFCFSTQSARSCPFDYRRNCP
ncbi:unnamed protein product [Adineta ricciae]|uniref:Uncharacterized protein n=1 Tax=Adineta ricciae TaxID=249248 RepID=A0A815IN78_ADIRI|nr:unnamed protein product [Adineta ricciae]CAF1365901.1 unnamed protein product [Adineta ricciae]